MKRIRYSILVTALAACLVSTACILPHKVSVPEVLAVNSPLAINDIIARINAYGKVDRIAVQTTIYVCDYLTGDPSKAKSFPGATGSLRAQRPELIRMPISFMGKNIADMSSDGRNFRVAIFYPDSNRAFIKGSNLQDYKRLNAEQIKEASDSRLRDAGALANIRPQHITAAFLIRPITPGMDDYIREEAREIEPDTRPGKKGRMVEKAYYILYLLDRGKDGTQHLEHKFWFDRTQAGTPLVRQQTFDNEDGRLGSDIRYFDFFQLNNSDILWPERVRIERRNDGYSIDVKIEKDLMEINSEIPASAFNLENTENLKEVDLDSPRKTSGENQTK